MDSIQTDLLSDDMNASGEMGEDVTPFNIGPGRVGPSHPPFRRPTDQSLRFY